MFRSCRALHVAASCLKSWAPNRKSHIWSGKPGMNAETDNQLADDLLRPVLHTSRRFYVAVAVFSAILLCGAATWGYQIYYGIGVTGYNWPVFWAFHETN